MAIYPMFFFMMYFVHQEKTSPVRKIPIINMCIARVLSPSASNATSSKETQVDHCMQQNDSLQRSIHDCYLPLHDTPSRCWLAPVGCHMFISPMSIGIVVSLGFSLLGHCPKQGNQISRISCAYLMNLMPG